MNVAIAGSIIFHHFGSWANYEEEGRVGFKFGDGNENKNNLNGKYKSIVTYIDYNKKEDEDGVFLSSD